MKGPMRGTRGRTIILVCVLLLAGCRSSSVNEGSLVATTPAEAWRSLLASAVRFEGGRVLASISIPAEGKRRTFRARVEVSREGDYALTAISPIGTELFEITVAGSEAMITDLRSKMYWRGSIAELAARTSPLFALDRVALSLAIFGLPDPTAVCSESPPNFLCRTTSLRYAVTNRGIVTITSTAGDLVELSPGFPPDELRYRSSGGRDEATIRVLEVVREATVVRLPTLGAEWKCCLAPTVPETENRP